MGYGTQQGSSSFVGGRAAAGVRPGCRNPGRARILLFCMIALLGLAAAAGADRPIASFTTNVTTGANPLAVQFVDTSTGNPVAWFWSFGDGGTSTQQEPSHTYTIDGAYTVTFTASNGDGSDTVTKAGYITDIKSPMAPVASFVSTGTAGSRPFTVRFVDTSANTPSSWAWSFGDGGTSTEQNPTHIYTTKGTFTVTLTATNTAGSSTTTKEAYVTVSEVSMPPVASFVASTTNGTTPLTVKFIDTSSNGPTTWIWTFGDGNSDLVENPVHTYTAEGTYTVTMTASNAIGSSTITKTGLISATQAAPIASFAANITNGTAPLTVQFNDTSANSPTYWSWYFGDGENIVAQNPVHMYTSAGSYTVALTAKNNVGYNTTTARGFINVTAIIAPATSFTASPRSGMSPLVVHFTDTSLNNPTSWQWTFGDGFSSQDQNPTHTYTSSGTYTVVLTATNTQGSKASSLEDGISVTGLTPTPTPTPEITETAAAAETPAPAATPTPASPATSGSLQGLLLPLLLILAAAAIIGILILRRRPPRGPHHSRRGDL